MVLHMDGDCYRPRRHGGMAHRSGSCSSWLHFALLNLMPVLPFPFIEHRYLYLPMLAAGALFALGFETIWRRISGSAWLPMISSVIFGDGGVWKWTRSERVGPLGSRVGEAAPCPVSRHRKGPCDIPAGHAAVLY